MRPDAPTEDQEQEMLFRWAELESGARPELRMMYAIPNGGFRHHATAARLKATGVKAGVPDVCLPYPARGCHGLYIEMKRTRGGRVSDSQVAWMDALMHQGYRCVVCRGFDEAREAVLAYIGKD